MSLNLGNLTDLFWGSPSLKPEEQTLQYFQNKEELYDPIYVAVTVGNIPFLDQKLQKEYQEEVAKAQREGRAPPSPPEIKLSFKENSTLKIANSCLYQGIMRRLTGEGRHELTLLRPHLVKLLRWFDPQDPHQQTILKACQAGIATILRGYKKQSQQLTITQKNGEGESPPTIIKLALHPPRAKDVIQTLESDIALLTKALQQKDKTQTAEFHQQLESEEAEYFPLHQLKVSIPGEDDKSMRVLSIDSYMKEQVTARWKKDKLQVITTHFQSTASTSFDHYDSIARLISPNPPDHEVLKERVRKLLATALSNGSSCTVKLLHSSEEKQ